MIAFTKHLLPSILLLFFVACAPFKPNSSARPLHKKQQVVFLDLALNNLNLVSVKETKTDSGQLEAFIELENSKNKDIWVDIQIVFLDGDGAEIERSSWEALQVHRRNLSSYEKVSMSSEAVSFRASLRKIK